MPASREPVSEQWSARWSERRTSAAMAMGLAAVVLTPMLLVTNMVAKPVAINRVSCPSTLSNSVAGWPQISTSTSGKPRADIKQPDSDKTMRGDACVRCAQVRHHVRTPTAGATVTPVTRYAYCARRSASLARCVIPPSPVLRAHGARCRSGATSLGGPPISRIKPT